MCPEALVDYPVVRVKLTSDVSLTPKKYEGDAGLDIASIEDVIIPPHSHRRIRSNFCAQLPENTFGLVTGRSGLAMKGILCHIGVIDQGYTGEVGPILFNCTPDSFVVRKGDRVAQLLILPLIRTKCHTVDEIESSDGRGKSGFGSTGKQ